MTREGLDQGMEDALRLLAHFAEREAGYLRHAVRGWLREEDISRMAGPAAVVALPALEERVLVERRDVRAPGVTRPVWLYRITGAGGRVAASLLGRNEIVVPLREAGRRDTSVYLPPGPEAALQALRSALETPQIDGDWGWKTIPELLALAGADPDRPEPFGLHDLEWLARGALAECRSVEGSVSWRATATGALVLILEWGEPEGVPSSG